jgi:cytochrome oxidase Cu insertion factor (SCO1/SenC/PrrC family)
MPRSRRWLTLWALALLAAPPLQAADPAPQKTGPAVGTKAPAFTLKDQSGQERSLDEFVKKGKVALVFYRSADW